MAPLLLVLAVIVWLFYRNSIKVEQAITRADGYSKVQLAAQTLSSELRMLRGDVLYLSEQASLREWLDSGGAPSLARVGEDFLAFARYRQLYDQIRFIDIRGQEQIRVNLSGDSARLVPVEALQDKSGRYYVEKTLKLERGDVYGSPFDLNVEQGAVELPVKPVIRVGTPVFDSQGEKRGFIMVNYLGRQLLDRLRHLSGRTGVGVWLLNADGYWLLGPEPDKEWGFMYPDRDADRFDLQYGNVWAAMQSGVDSGQLTNDLGIFTYARFVPHFAENKEKHWFIVTHTPSDVLMAGIRRQSSSFFWIFVILALVLALLSGLVAYNDIQRRRTTMKVQESEHRFRGLLDSAPDAIVIVDESGRIQIVNTRVESWFGYSRAELVGQPVEILVPERQREKHVTHRQGYNADPIARSMGVALELYGRRKDGSEFPIEISLSPLQTEQGLLITSIIRDVTDRKLTEEAEHQVRVRYQELVNNLPVGVYRNTPGPQGHFIEVNPAMITIFEADSVADLLATPVSGLYCDTDDRRAFNEKILRQGFVTAEELRLKTLKGREFYGAITAVVKKDNNNILYYDGIVEDITERKDNELRIRELNKSLRHRSMELHATNLELEAFSYSVSHDLRAPLRAMDGFSRTLLDQYGEQLDDRGRDRLNRIRAAAQRMARLIDDLLNLSRVSRTETHRECVDLTSLAQTVIRELQENEPDRTVAVSVAPGLTAEADARLVRIMLDNLLGNAWKFTGHSPDAAIEFDSRQEGKERIYYVRDNGAGFDMAYADKLFGAFQRLHDNGEFPGTGIGLATVQRIVHKHGGRVWAESAVGQGATFYFTL